MPWIYNQELEKYGPFKPRNRRVKINSRTDNIEFQVIEWNQIDLAVEDDDEESSEDSESDMTKQYCIRCFGITREGYSVGLQITNFPPRFYVKVPDNWENYHANCFIDALRSKVWWKIKNDLTTFRLLDAMDIDGFNNNRKFKFIQMFFRTDEARRKFSYALYKPLYIPSIGGKERIYPLYEANIEPILRFAHIQGLLMCGWYRLPAKKYTVNSSSFSHCQIDVTIPWRFIEHIDSEEIAPLRQASFDIETYAVSHQVPLADRTKTENMTAMKSFLEVVIQKGLKTGKFSSIEEAKEFVREEEERIDRKIEACKYKHDVVFQIATTIQDYGYDSYKKSILIVSRMASEELEVLIKAFGKWGFSDVDVITRPDQIAETLRQQSYRILLIDVPTVSKRIVELNQIYINDNYDDGKDPFSDRPFIVVTSRSHKLINFAKRPNVDIPVENFVDFDLDTALANANGEQGLLKQLFKTGHKRGEKYLQHMICLGDTGPIDGAVVECYETEEEVLLAWSRMIRRMDPDLFTGYNIFGYDFKFLYQRAQILGILDKFHFLGKIRDEASELITKTLDSAAYGKNDFHYIPMSGRLMIDLYPVMKRGHKLRSYKLDYVAEKFLGEKKHDVSPKDIFECFERNTPKDLKLIAEYCIQDTMLPQRLLNKMDIIPNYIQMANVTRVPFSYLIFRGEQIKVFSNLAKKSRELGYLIPTIRHADEADKNEKYKGATVLTSKRGAYYKKPVTTLDFASLYPTIMIDHNLCYTTIVKDPQYDNIPGVQYQTQEWDDYDDETGEFLRHHKYRFVQNQEGVLPMILKELLGARKQAKRQMAATNDPFKKSIYNGKQLALKVSCNSVYGFTGASRGMLPCVPIAASVTTFGRKKIEQTQEFVENPVHFQDITVEDYPDYKYSCEVVYGDSVTHDTPILVKRSNGVIEYVQIEDIAKENDWYQIDIKSDSPKEFADPENGLQVWSDKGWTPLVQVIRHRTSKRIYRVITNTGCVDVTEDHSLLDLNGNAIHTKDCQIGTKLLHRDLPLGNHDYREYMNRWIICDDPTDNKLEAANIYWKYQNLMRTCLTYKNSKYHIQPDVQNCGLNTQIVEIINLGHTNEYVYDLETANHHFAAGIGRMVVHNTDSVFCCFDFPEEWTDLKRRQESFRIGMIVGERCTDHLRTLNIYMPNDQAFTDLEFEKVYDPLILLTKKRYIGSLFEKSPEKPDYTDMKGVVLKRRDNCIAVQKVMGAGVKKLMEKDFKGGVQVVKDMINDMFNDKFGIEDFVISKSLKRPEDYANPDSMAHLQLALKMKMRDPGSAPQPGSRIPFVFKEIVEKKDTKQKDRVEDPGYIQEHPEENIKLDYQYYCERQFETPLIDLYSTFMDDAEELFRDAKRAYVNRKKGQKEIYNFFKKTDPDSDKKREEERNRKLDEDLKQTVIKKAIPKRIAKKRKKVQEVPKRTLDSWFKKK